MGSCPVHTCMASTRLLYLGGWEALEVHHNPPREVRVVPGVQCVKQRPKWDVPGGGGVTCVRGARGAQPSHYRGHNSCVWTQTHGGLCEACGSGGWVVGGRFGGQRGRRLPLHAPLQGYPLVLKPQLPGPVHCRHRFLKHAQHTEEGDGQVAAPRHHCLHRGCRGCQAPKDTKQTWNAGLLPRAIDPPHKRPPRPCSHPWAQHGRGLKGAR